MKFPNGSLIGRFISADTVTPGGPQGLNRYSYAINNPINYNDPSGHTACSDIPNSQARAYCESKGGVPGFGDDSNWLVPPSIPPSPSGGDPSTPWQVGIEWLTGQGPRDHEFRDGDYFTVG